MSYPNAPPRQGTRHGPMPLLASRHTYGAQATSYNHQPIHDRHAGYYDNYEDDQQDYDQMSDLEDGDISPDPLEYGSQISASAGASGHDPYRASAAIDAGDSEGGSEQNESGNSPYDSPYDNNAIDWASDSEQDLDLQDSDHTQISVRSPASHSIHYHDDDYLNLNDDNDNTAHHSLRNLVNASSGSGSGSDASTVPRPSGGQRDGPTPSPSPSLSLSLSPIPQYTYGSRSSSLLITSSDSETLRESSPGASPETSQPASAASASGSVSASASSLQGSRPPSRSQPRGPPSREGARRLQSLSSHMSDSDFEVNNDPPSPRLPSLTPIYYPNRRLPRQSPHQTYPSINPVHYSDPSDFSNTSDSSDNLHRPLQHPQQRRLGIEHTRRPCLSVPARVINNSSSEHDFFEEEEDSGDNRHSRSISFEDEDNNHSDHSNRDSSLSVSRHPSHLSRSSGSQAEEEQEAVVLHDSEDEEEEQEAVVLHDSEDEEEEQEAVVLHDSEDEEEEQEAVVLYDSEYEHEEEVAIIHHARQFRAQQFLRRGGYFDLQRQLRVPQPQLDAEELQAQLELNEQVLQPPNLQQLEDNFFFGDYPNNHSNLQGQGRDPSFPSLSHLGSGRDMDLDDELVEIVLDGMGARQSLQRQNNIRQNSQPPNHQAEVVEVIDLTEEPDSPDRFVQNHEGSNLGRLHYRAARRPRRMAHNSRPPSLARTDGSILGRRALGGDVQVIDLTSDDDVEQPANDADDDEGLFVLQNNDHIPANRRLPPPVPAHQGHIIHHGGVMNRARDFIDNPHVRHFGRGIRARVNDLYAAFSNMPMPENNARIGEEPLQADINPVNPLAGNQPMLNYRANGFANRHAPPQKPQFEEPPPARPGFTRNTGPDPVTGEELKFICAGCGEELKYYEDEDGDERPAKRPRNRKDREQHPFWAVKACGHVYCKSCYDDRKKVKQLGEKYSRMSFRVEQPGKTPKIYCAVSDCDSEVTSAPSWVGIFM